MALGICPSCGMGIEINNRLSIGLRVKCHTCGTPLELVWLEPIQLDWLFNEDRADIDEDDDFDDLGEYGDYEELDENKI